MKPRFDWTETIKLNTFILKVVGMWPEGDDGSYGFNFYTFYAITSILTLSCCHSLAEILVILDVTGDLNAIAGSMVMPFSISLSVFKSYSIIINMKTLKKLIGIVNCDMFQPKSPQQRNMVEISLKTWKKFHLFFVVVAFNTVASWGAYPIVDKSFKEHRLPFVAWYPYKISVSPNYEITYIHQIIATLFVGMVNVNTDCFIGALHTYIGAQIDILCDDLRNISHSDFNRQLLNCIKHHKQILEFTKDSNGVYNWIIFAQFFVAVITLAVSLFQLTTVIPFSTEFFSIVIYGVAVTMQVFTYCWFGNEIEIKSRNIPYAAFESNWTGASLKTKNNMIFFVLNCLKPIKVSALNLFYLTLDNFIAILRTSYSYYAVLHQVNARN